MKILIDAYFNQNLGDDLFIHLLCQRYPNIDFYAWSKYSLDEPNFHNLYNRFENRLFSKENIYKRHFHFVDAVVMIGGSMFMEGISRNPDLGRLNKPFFILGANFGPFQSRQYLEDHQAFFSRAMDVCFRDSDSQKLFPHDSRSQADLIFNLSVPEIPKKKQVFVSVMNLEQQEYWTFLAEQIREFHGQDYEIIACSFCDNEGDLTALKQVEKLYPFVRTIRYQGENLEIVLEKLLESEIVLATRFHSILLGLLAKASILAYSYNPKTDHYLSDLGIEPVDPKGQIYRIDSDYFKSAKPGLEDLKQSAGRQFEKLDQFIKGEIL